MTGPRAVPASPCPRCRADWAQTYAWLGIVQALMVMGNMDRRDAERGMEPHVDKTLAVVHARVIAAVEAHESAVLCEKHGPKRRKAEPA